MTAAKEAGLATDRAFDGANCIHIARLTSHFATSAQLYKSSTGAEFRVFYVWEARQMAICELMYWGIILRNLEPKNGRRHDFVALQNLSVVSPIIFLQFGEAFI